jgi:hypothetical protein
MPWAGASSPPTTRNTLDLSREKEAMEVKASIVLTKAAVGPIAYEVVKDLSVAEAKQRNAVGSINGCVQDDGDDEGDDGLLALIRVATPPPKETDVRAYITRLTS